MSTSERIGDCHLLFELASGGMAKVFLARQAGDAGFERLVAVKRIHPHLVEDPEVFAMASDEARLAALVRHNNVVAVTGVFDTGGELVLVQDYVEGASLARVVRALAERGERLSPSVAVRIAIDASKGLHATHEATDLRGEPLEIVHRDVSPQNLLVGADGTTRLIDFGIARAERRMSSTRTGVLKGKLAYMAPEQVAEKDVDRRADVYAVGAVLYEMLSGKRAFAAGDDAALMARILTGDVDLGALPESLAPVVERALATTPVDRYESALELSRALREAQVPAGDDEVAELVGRLFGEELARVRERVAAAVARIELDGPASSEGSAQASVAPSSAPASAPSAGARRSAAPRSAWLPAIVAGALAILAVVAWLGRREPAAAPSVAPTTVAASSAAPASRPAPPTAIDAAALDSTSRPADAPPPASSASAVAYIGAPAAPAPQRSASPSPRASSVPEPTTSARPELHPSPYATH